MISLGISGDKDNDLYDKISDVSFKNPKFSLYGIHIGDSTIEGTALLKKYGFNFEGGFLKKDEYVIASGEKTK
jgi:flavodoxin